MFNALKFLGGLRVGEAAAVRWTDYHDDRPLKRIQIQRSYNTRSKLTTTLKTDDPRRREEARRDVPVHPVLEAILADWKERGWKEYFGRDPEPGDLICPSFRDASPSSSAELKYVRKDCVKLGIEEPGVLTGDVQAKRGQRRAHGVHQPSRWRRCGQQVGQGDHVPAAEPAGRVQPYLRENWPKMCEAVLHLKLTPRRREPLSQAEVVGA